MKLNKQSGINIVSVDYVAKAIMAALTSPVKQLNIVSSKCVPGYEVVKTILDKTGIDNWEAVRYLPDNQNSLEKLYYKTVGEQFNPYWDTSAHEFDTSELRNLLPTVEEPDVKHHFESLFDYALQNKFKTVIG